MKSRGRHALPKEFPPYKLQIQSVPVHQPASKHNLNKILALLVACARVSSVRACAIRTHVYTQTQRTNLGAQVVVDPASLELVPRELESRLPTRGGSNGAAKHEGVLVHMVYRETPVGCLAARIRDRYYAGLIG